MIAIALLKPTQRTLLCRYLFSNSEVVILVHFWQFCF